MIHEKTYPSSKPVFAMLARTTVWLPLLVAGLAFFLRFYRLAFPLWLDEFYSLQVVQLELPDLLRNSLKEPHPPLFYLIQKWTTASGLYRHELAWRWLPALAGSLTIPLVFVAARRLVRFGPALLASLWLALMPYHLLYSQEGRAFVVITLCAALSALLVARLLEAPKNAKWWLGWLIVSLTGMYLAYAYFLVLAVQVFFLWLRLGKRREIYLYALGVGMLLLPAMYAVLSTFGDALGVHAQRERLTFLFTLQNLFAGDALRYGVFWPHAILPLVALFLLGVASWLTWRRRGEVPAAQAGFALFPPFASLDLRAYFLLQVLAPLAVFFGLFLPLSGIALANFESKQFLVLLPAWMVCAAMGLDVLWRKPGTRLLAALLMLAVFAGSLAGVQRYFATPKAMEGPAVLFLRGQLQPQDAVVSLHYSLTGAASFYLEEPNFFKPVDTGEGRLQLVKSMDILHMPGAPQATEFYTANDLLSYGRVWVLAKGPPVDALNSFLFEACESFEMTTFGPFLVLRYTGCEGE